MAEDKKDTTDTAADATRSNADRATEAMNQGAQRARDSFNEHVMDPARRAGEAMRDGGRRVAEQGSTIGMKLIDQAETNAQQAFAAMRAAAGAKDLSEVMKIQGDYVREQGTRAMTHAREISEMIVQFGKDAVSSLRPGDNNDKPQG